MKPTEQQIDELLNQVAEATDQGETKFPGMSYEQGVEAGINWVLGRTDSHPYED